uniref:Reverse transcriptase domain-containing protein n=1 Tax=Strongyloides venezuelensis TaxID=75913 RepID=A0A0K0FSW3_STRVS
MQPRMGFLLTCGKNLSRYGRNFSKQNRIRISKKSFLEGGCVLEDVPHFLFFHVENSDVGELYADLDPRMYLENATMLLDNVEDCPVQFPSENMPPALEVLMIENGTYPEAQIKMNELLESLDRLKILWLKIVLLPARLTILRIWFLR